MFWLVKFTQRAHVFLHTQRNSLHTLTCASWLVQVYRQYFWQCVEPLWRLFVVRRLQRAQLLPCDRSAVSRMFPLLHLFIVASCIFFSCCRPQDLVPACALLCCVSRYPLTPFAGVGRWPAPGMIVQWFAEQVSSLSVALPGVCFCSYFGFWPGKLISAVCLAGQVNPLKLCCVLRSF